MDGKSVKIRELAAPEADLSSFDPGKYLSDLEFYETRAPITEEDRDGLAQFVHFLAFLALQGKSTGWSESSVAPDSLAYRALDSHFSHLDGWARIAQDGKAISYRALATTLMQPYPPRRPRE